MKTAKAIVVNSLRTAGSAILFFSLMFLFHLLYGAYQQESFSTDAKTGAIIATAMVTAVVFVYFFYFWYQVFVLTFGKRKRLLAFFVPLAISVALAASGGYLYMFDDLWRGKETGLVYIGYGFVGAIFTSFNYKIFIR